MDSDIDIKTLEQIRHRLISLSGTIRNLQGQFQAQYQPEGLPTWRHISTIQDTVKSHLQALQEIFLDDDKSAFLKSAHAYPTSAYPWSEENTLALLLRKRLEPDIVTWVNDARAVGVGLDAVDDGPAAESAADEMAMDVDREEGVGRLKSEDWAELWDWAAPAANQIAREVLLEPEEDDVDEDEEEEEEGSGHQNEKEAVNTAQKPQKPPDIPMMKLEDILKFSSTGFIPRGPKASRA